MGGTSPLSTAATIDRLSAVPVRNVLRYIDCSYDSDALTGALRNFHAVGRSPATFLEFRLNKVRCALGLHSTPPEERFWERFVRQQLQLMWRALFVRHELYFKSTPPNPVLDPFNDVYGTLDIMMTRRTLGNDAPTVADYPDWSDVLAYKTPADEALVYRSPEFCLQVFELARLRHGDKCRGALANVQSTGDDLFGQRFHNARTWPAGYSVLLRFAMVALDMIGADASHLLPYTYLSPVPLEAYVLNGSDIFEHDELKIEGFADENHRTLLSTAIPEAQPRVVKALLEYRKVDVTAQHNQALAVTCSMGHMELAKP
ncbi:hypothetical protein HDU89_005730 [Geranomyces variabilis]|nr:hypothetical protein HDU89_005730 [Geranomyces variabilis]